MFHAENKWIAESRGGDSAGRNGKTKLQQQLDVLNQIMQNNSLAEGDVSVYPNPAYGVITVNYLLDKNQIAIFEIHDLTGNTMLEETIYGNVNSKKISISNLVSGIYMFRFKTKGKASYTGKLIIE
jgi:hypothetical protein